MKAVDLMGLTGLDEQLRRLLETAVRAAGKAGGIIYELYDKPHTIRHKGEIDLVTEADVASEEAIISILEKKCPGITVLAEESQNTYDGAPEEPVWIIDPLDGTTNFAHGFPFFCVSIGYMEEGRMRAGVIYLPMLDELFYAAENSGAWLNGNRIHVSAETELIKALIATGFPYDIEENLQRIMNMTESVLPRVRDIRRAGAAAIDLAYVACGRLDGFWEMNLKPWDTAAGQLLVEEAGGRMSDFAGNTFSNFAPQVVATNGRIHQDLVDLLQDSD